MEHFTASNTSGQQVHSLGSAFGFGVCFEAQVGDCPPSTERPDFDGVGRRARVAVRRQQVCTSGVGRGKKATSLPYLTCSAPLHILAHFEFTYLASLHLLALLWTVVLIIASHHAVSSGYFKFTHVSLINYLIGVLLGSLKHILTPTTFWYT